VHLPQVRQPLVQGVGAGSEHHCPFCWRNERELAEAGREFRVISRLISGEIRDHVVQQFAAGVGDRIDQARRPAFLRYGGPGDGAGLLEPLERRVQRVVVQDETGGLLDSLAQFIPVRRAAPQVAEDHDLYVRHMVHV